MRLRLTVRRNGVPEVKLMWNVQADADFTISRLLANVNDVIPLESAEWRLEDYAVEYRDGEDGFECLHFQVVSDILKESDQVLIRPLLTNDLRRRRLSGRHQITADGRHLVDGVAFGRPWLRTPVNRPGIELPPRKRARISYRLNGDENGDQRAGDSSMPTSEDGDYSYANPIDSSEDEEQLLLEAPKDTNEAPGTVVGEGYVQDGTPNIGDSTLTPEAAANLTSLRDDSPPLPAYPGESEPSAAHAQTLSPILNTIRGTHSSAPADRNKQHAVQEPDASDSSEDASSDDSSSASNSDASESSSSADTDSDGSSDSGSSSDEEEAGTRLGSTKKKPMGGNSQASDSGSTSSPSEEDVKGRASASAADGASSESSDSDDSSDSSDSSSDSSAESEPKKQVAIPALPPPKPALQEPKPVAAGATPLSRTQKRNIRKREARRHKSALEQGAAEAASPATGIAAADDEFTKRRQALLESLEGGASPAATPKKRKAQDEETESKPRGQNGSAPPSAKGQDSTASQRRKGFDFGAPGRLLFGALGFGGSKDKEEEQPLDSRTNGHDEIPQEGESEESEDSDAWKDKVNYRAVECVREGVELSEPPFPFVQRWDPQQSVDVWYGNNKRGGKGKRKQRNQAHYYEEDTGHGKKRKTSPWPEVLEYDEDANMDEGAEENEVEKENSQDAYGTPEDLPALPEDLNTLPRLVRGEATVGMVVTWKQWLLSKATNWQPQFGNVTGVVVRLDKSDPDAIYLVLAKRDRNLDRNEKEYDPQTGQRIYGGFEAPDFDDEEGEEGEEDEDEKGRLVSFAGMAEPRVVQRQSRYWQASLGNFRASLSGNESAIPDSLQQNGQGDTNFEPLSLDLQVPFSTDPGVADGNSEAEQPAPSDLAEGNSQKNALDVPSAVSSVASGRRQPDPNSLPASIEFDMVIPDSAPEPNAGKVRSQGSQGRNSRRGSVQRGQEAVSGANNSPAKDKDHQTEIGGTASPIPDAPAEEIKPAGRAQSFFEMEDEYLPKKLRREANGLAAVKMEADREADEEGDGVIDLKKEASLPRLIFPDRSPPRFGSQKENGQKKKKRKDRSSPFEVPLGSQVIDLVSEGDSGVGTPLSSQKQKNGTPRGQSQNGTPRSSQKRNGTPASQRGRKGTPASQKKGSQKGDGLPKGSGWVTKRKGWKAETAI